MKLSYIFILVIITLSMLLLRTAETARQYERLATEQRLQLRSLKAEHDYFLLPTIGVPLARPMIVSESGLRDSVVDGIYVRALSTCVPCQLLHDSLEVAGISATFLMEESNPLCHYEVRHDLVGV